MLRIIVCLIALSLAACERYSTEEMVPVRVDFEDVDWYAERAQLAYGSESEIRRALADVVAVEVIDHYDLQFFVEQLEGGRQLVAVRGTASLANVREDVEYAKSRNRHIDILVHKGFDEDASALFEQLLPHLDKRQEILATGHSLGAAVSSLLMIYLYHEGYRVGPSVNFGQPKFTNKEGAEKYSFLPLKRVVNRNDVVPLVPPATPFSLLGGEYLHFGEEIILLDGPNFVYLDQHIALEKDLSELWPNLGHISVEDHFMANYRKSIGQKIDEQVEVAFRDREKFL